MRYSRLENTEDYESFFSAFEQSFISRGAPNEMALFVVRKDGHDVGLVVSSQTLALAPDIASARNWYPIDQLERPLTWALLIGHSDALENFEITLGEFR